MRKLITHPAVYMPTAILLLTTTVWITFTWIGPAWERRQHERTMAKLLAWSPEPPWSITVDDFPTGAARELPADEEWLYVRSGDAVALGPWQLPGLEHVLYGLPFDYLWYETRGTDAATWSLNGVTVGETDVFSFAGALTNESIRVTASAELLDHQRRLTHLEGLYAERRDHVVEYEAIGDRLTLDERRARAGAPFHPGKAGYYGNRVMVVDEATGERLQVVGVATVVGDAFIAVGTVTPVGVEPDAGAVELLELLGDKVRGDPPEVTSAVRN